MRSSFKIYVIVGAMVMAIVIPKPILAAERTLLVDTDGKVYELTKKSGLFAKDGLTWTQVQPNTFSDPEMQRPADEKKSVGGLVRIQGNHVEINQGGGWVDAGFTPPPPGVTYRDAHIDSNGNIAVELGGKWRGFNFRLASGTVVVAGKMGNPAPSFKQMTALPSGDGMLGLTEQGAVVKVDLPERTNPYRPTEILPPGSAEDLVLTPRGVVIRKPGGQLELLGNDLRVVPLPLPDGIHPSERQKLISSYSPEARDLVIAAKQRFEQAASAAERVQSAAQADHVKEAAAPAKHEIPVTQVALNSGEKIVEKDGRKIKVDAQGNEIPYPVSTLKEVEGDQKAEDFLNAMQRNMTDEIAMDHYFGKRTPFFGRDYETQRSIEMLSRYKGPNPVLTGEAGVGKTAIAEYLAQKSFYNEFPTALRSDNAMRNSIWVESSPDLISMLAKSNDPNSQAAAVRKYVASLRYVQKKLGRPMVVFIDEAHMLSEAQLNALKPILESRTQPVRFVLSTTNREYGLMVKRDPAVERRMPRVDVPEFTPEQTSKLIHDSVIPIYQHEYRGMNGKSATITDDAVQKVISRAREYLPNSAFPEGPIKLLMDVTTRSHLQNNGAAPVVDGKDVSKFVQEDLRLPIDPDAPDFDKKLDGIKQELRDKVVEQGPLTDRLVENFRNVIDSEGGKTHRTVLITGTTGSGKSYGIEETAKKLVGESRTIVIDGTKYANAGGNISIIMNDLLGAPPGVLSSDQTAGILPEFLSGRGRGLNFIVINEADKMDPEALKRLMEMFDRGVLSANDGKEYRLGKSIIGLTTNKGSELIYPRKESASMSRKEIEARAYSMSKDEIRDLFVKPDPNNLYSDKVLPPETVQRIDDALVSLPPTKDGALKILKNEVATKSQQIEKYKGYTVAVDENVLKDIVERHYDAKNGVREPKRILIDLMEEAKAAIRRESGKPEKGEKIEISLRQPDPKKPPEFFVKRPATGAQADLPAIGKGTTFDPMSDPVMRDRLVSYERNIKKHVFGQDDMVSVAAESARNQFMNPYLEQPSSLLMLGSTGTGKTELVKAEARELFGSEDRAFAMNMGEITNEVEFNNIFSPPKGVEGSQKMSDFERFLMANEKTGGVLLFDEIGNMGGGDPKMKTRLWKRFYSMLDEGVYVGPVSGRVYDLRRFLVRMTSNEGQEFFQDLPSDDLRLAAWEQQKHPGTLRSYLVKNHGYPEALMARIDHVVLAKPLIEGERTFIGEKFLRKLEKNYHSIAGLKSVSGDADFYHRLGETFFSHEEGARLMRRTIDKGVVSSLMNQARLSLEPSLLEGADAVYSISDNYAGKAHYEGDFPPEREVHVTLKLTKDGKEIGTFKSPNVVEDAAVKSLHHMDDLRMVAIHEAGHIVTNDPALTGTVTDYVTVQGAGGYGGYARAKEVRKFTGMTRQRAVAAIGRMLGGQEAVVAAGLEPNSGWSADIKQAREFAQQAIGQFGLTKNHEDALRLPTKDGKVDIGSKAAQSEIESLMHDGLEYSQSMIKKNWNWLVGLSDEMVQRPALSRADIERIHQESKEPHFIEKLNDPAYRSPAGLSGKCLIRAINRLESGGT